jgi:hypothetical protein
MNIVEYTWQRFLRQEWHLNETDTLPTHKWVEHLVRSGLLPLLKDKGYTLLCRPQELATCILNNLLRHQRDYQMCKFTTYRCPHREESCLEEFEFYEEQIPETVWNKLKETFYIEWFADEHNFAERVWRHLPLIVFDHLSMDSPANEILYEKMGFLEEESSSEPD